MRSKRVSISRNKVVCAASNSVSSGKHSILRAPILLSHSLLAGLLWLTSSLPGTVWPQNAAQANALETPFRQPVLSDGPWVFWRWPWSYAEKIKSAGITAELEAMAQQGIGGVMIDTVGKTAVDGKAAPYLSEAWLALISHALHECRRLGLGFYIHNCDGWANSGGPWITPELSMKQLSYSMITVSGPRKFSGELEAPKALSNFYRDLTVLAWPAQGNDLYPQRVSNLGPIDPDGQVQWHIPDGEWHLMRLGYTTTGKMNHPATSTSMGLECDKINPAGIDTHLKAIEPLLKTLRSHKGDHAVYVGVDSWECGWQNWTDGLPEQFKARFGYDLWPWLPVTAGWRASNSLLANRFQEDFNDHIRGQFSTAYISRLGEALKAYDLRTQCQSVPEASDVPMGEFWAATPLEMKHGPKPSLFLEDDRRRLSVPNDVPPLGRGMGHAIIASESFTSRSQNWERTPACLKSGVDWALASGYNKITFHLWAMQPDNGIVPHYTEHGTAVNRHLTWWSMAHGWFDYIQRAQHLLRQGTYVSDTCFIDANYLVKNPEVWSNGLYTPDFPPRYHYDLCTWDRLSIMQVREQTIVMPEGASYRLLVLPARTAISRVHLEKLAALVKAGAAVLGPKPERVRGLSGYPESDSQIQALAAELWGAGKKGERTIGKGTVLWGMSVREALDQLGIEADFSAEKLEPNGPVLDWCHRRSGDTHIYFIANRCGENIRFNARLRVTGLAPEYWDPVSGRIEGIGMYRMEGRSTSIPLSIDPWASCFIVLRRAAGRHLKRAEGPKGALYGNEFISDGKSIRFFPREVGLYRYQEIGGAVRTIYAEAMPLRTVLSGPWKMSFLSRLGDPPATLVAEQLGSWTRSDIPAVRHYSGQVSYEINFDLDAKWFATGRRMYLDLGVVGEMAEVKLNGQGLGVLWVSPYRIDISTAAKPGSNRLVITVANTWLNRFVADRALPNTEQCTAVGFATQQYTKETPPLPSGLIGPVVIESCAQLVIP